MECNPTKKRCRLAHNVFNILRNSYNTKPTVAARLKGAGVRFIDTVSIATPIETSHHINKAGIEKCRHFINGPPTKCVVYSRV